MQPIVAYRHFGLLAFLLLLAGLAFIVWKWPEGKHLTFSQHVALSKQRIVYYVLLFSITLPLLLLFVAGWFAPILGLPLVFTIFIIIASITQYTCTLIPEIGGWKTRYHRLLAGISAVCLLPPMFLLFVAEAVTTPAKIIVAASLLAMFIVIWLLIAGRGKHSYFLYLQAIYFFAFFASVLFITYLQ